MKFVDTSKKCYFCENKDVNLDYKNSGVLLRFVNYFGKMKKSYYTGNCRKHQHSLSKAVKKGRHMGLISFTR